MIETKMASDGPFAQHSANHGSQKHLLRHHPRDAHVHNLAHWIRFGRIERLIPINLSSSNSWNTSVFRDIPYAFAEVLWFSMKRSTIAERSIAAQNPSRMQLQAHEKPRWHQAYIPVET
jgi:hypothetical protein